MKQMVKKDIFISYRNDGSGNQFASRLCNDLENAGYSVYFNSNEGRTHSFPERLKQAVENCKDFVLVLSKGCLERLKVESDSIDWVKEELLTAWKAEKHIIPILLDGVDMPDVNNDLPDNLKFLPYIDALRFPEQYLRSPFSEFQGILLSKQDGKDLYKDSFNNNSKYNLADDLNSLLGKAKAGDVRAMYEAGLMYYYGATNEEGSMSGWDYEKAVYWLKKVSESDDEMKYHADNIIARLYYLGEMPGEAQSYEKSLEYHIKAAPMSPYSASNQAFMMRCGIGCEFDYEKIVKFYEENTNENDDVMMGALANFMVLNGKYSEAMDIYDRMTVLSPEIQYRIGCLYRDGVIFDPPHPDCVQAAYYFREAADAGHMQAAYEYGLLCFRPKGRFRKNFRNAEKYLKIAADSGNAEAQYILGFMYKGGHVTKDYAKAIEYFEKAKAHSHSFSALELSFLYQQPGFINYQRAYECAKMAAEHGYSEGYYVLGNLLFWGRGCKADMNKAYEMYDKAYKSGFYDGLFMKEKIEKLR